MSEANLTTILDWRVSRRRTPTATWTVTVLELDNRIRGLNMVQVFAGEVTRLAANTPQGQRRHGRDPPARCRTASPRSTR